MARHDPPCSPPTDDRQRSALARFLAHLSPTRGDRQAAALIDAFGSAGAALAQSEEAIARATGCAAAARALILSTELCRQWLREDLVDRPLVGNTDAVVAYLRARQGFALDEEVRVLFLNARHVLIRDEFFARGTVDQAPIWPRSILRRCLELNAASVILVHNHPSGDHFPSAGDRDATRRFIAAARELDIELQDHLVVSATGASSLRALGYL